MFHQLHALIDDATLARIQTTALSLSATKGRHVSDAEALRYLVSTGDVGGSAIIRGEAAPCGGTSVRRLA